MIVMALLLLIALLQLDRANLLYSMKQIPLWIVILLFSFQVLTQLLINLQFHQVAKLCKISLSFRDIFYINSQGAVVDAITPGVKFGGEVTRAVQISRIGNCTGAQGAAMVALQKLFSLSTMFIIFLFVAGYLVGEVWWLSTGIMQILVYGILLLSLLFFLGIFLKPHPIKAYLQMHSASSFKWLERVKVFLIELLSQVENARKNKRVFVMLFLLSFFIWLLYPVKMYFLAALFYPGANIIHVMAITFAAYMVAMLPIFPGGLGGFEGTMTGLLVTMGIVISDAAVMTIFFRFVTFWFVMLLSVMYVMLYKVVLKARKRNCGLD